MPSHPVSLAYAPSRFARQFLSVAMLCAIAACSSRGGAASAPAVDQTLITREELVASSATNLFDAVQRLRANWLRTRGTDSFETPTVIQVYLDNQRVGGVEQLRQLSPLNVSTLRHYDGIQATARWGINHGAGAIVVTTLRR
jgi:hypothetical protein